MILIPVLEMCGLHNVLGSNSKATDIYCVGGKLLIVWILLF